MMNKCPRCGAIYEDAAWVEDVYKLCYKAQNGCWNKFEDFCSAKGYTMEDGPGLEDKAYQEFMGFGAWVERVRNESKDNES